MRNSIKALVAIGAGLALVACGSTPGDLSPVASSAALSEDAGAAAASGYGRGPGAAPSPAPTPGTCTGECDGSGQGPGPGNGQGNGPGYGPGNGQGQGPGHGPGNGLCGDACTGVAGPDPADIVSILQSALQEEYRAEMLYRSVLEDYPGAVPFVAIADSEARHVEALQWLFERRELTPPPAAWAPSAFPPFATLAAACAAGVTAEKEDAAFYTPYLERTDLPRDVRNVFTNLQAASLENHLPAFESCQ